MPPGLMREYAMSIAVAACVLHRSSRYPSGLLTIKSKNIVWLGMNQVTLDRKETLRLRLLGKEPRLWVGFEFGSATEGPGRPAMVPWGRILFFVSFSF